MIHQIRDIYRILYRQVSRTMENGDQRCLKKAFRLALAADAKATKGAQTEIPQQLEVARILAEELELGANYIVAALVHGGVKEVNLVAIEKKFGADVATMLTGMVALAPVSFLKDARELNSYNGCGALSIASPDVLLLKAAGIIQEMRALERASNEKQRYTTSEALNILIFQLQKFRFFVAKEALEDLQLKLTNPTAHATITERLNRLKSEKADCFAQFVANIQTTLQSQKIPFRLKKRIKSVAAIHHKMTASALPFGQVYDIFGLRIILDIAMREEEEEYCWQIYEAALGPYKKVAGRFRDWIAEPRENGYQSLHDTVLSDGDIMVEVQIRSKWMDLVAELGRAATWGYKGRRMGSRLPELDDWFDEIIGTIAPEGTWPPPSIAKDA